MPLPLHPLVAKFLGQTATPKVKTLYGRIVGSPRSQLRRLKEAAEAEELVGDATEFKNIRPPATSLVDRALDALEVPPDHPLREAITGNVKAGIRARGGDPRDRTAELLELTGHRTLATHPSGRPKVSRPPEVPVDPSRLMGRTQNYRGVVSPGRLNPKTGEVPTKEQAKAIHSPSRWVRAQVDALESQYDNPETNLIGSADMPLTQSDGTVAEFDATQDPKFTGLDPTTGKRALTSGKKEKALAPLGHRQGIRALMYGRMPQGWEQVGDDGMEFTVTNERGRRTASEPVRLWRVSKTPDPKTGRHSVKEIDQTLIKGFDRANRQMAQEQLWTPPGDADALDYFEEIDKGRLSSYVFTKDELASPPRQPGDLVTLSDESGSRTLTRPASRVIVFDRQGNFTDEDVRQAAVAMRRQPSALLRQIKMSPTPLYWVHFDEAVRPAYARKELWSDLVTPVTQRRVSEVTPEEAAADAALPTEAVVEPPAYLDRASFLEGTPRITLPNGKTGELLNVASRARPEQDITERTTHYTRGLFDEHPEYKIDRSAAPAPKEGTQVLYYREVPPPGTGPRSQGLASEPTRGIKRMVVQRDVTEADHARLTQEGFVRLPDAPTPSNFRPGMRLLYANPDGRVLVTQPYDWSANDIHLLLKADRAQAPTHYVGRIFTFKSDPKIVRRWLERPPFDPESPPNYRELFESTSPAEADLRPSMGSLETPVPPRASLVEPQTAAPDARPMAEAQFIEQAQEYLRQKNTLLHLDVIGIPAPEAHVRNMRRLGVALLRILPPWVRSRFAQLDKLHTTAILSKDQDAQWEIANQISDLYQWSTPEEAALLRKVRGPDVEGKSRLDFSPYIDPGPDTLLSREIADLNRQRDRSVRRLDALKADLSRSNLGLQELMRSRYPPFSVLDEGTQGAGAPVSSYTEQVQNVVKGTPITTPRTMPPGEAADSYIARILRGSSQSELPGWPGGPEGPAIIGPNPLPAVPPLGERPLRPMGWWRQEGTLPGKPTIERLPGESFEDYLVRLNQAGHFLPAESLSAPVRPPLTPQDLIRQLSELPQGAPAEPPRMFGPARPLSEGELAQPYRGMLGPDTREWLAQREAKAQATRAFRQSLSPEDLKAQDAERGRRIAEALARAPKTGVGLTALIAALMGGGLKETLAPEEAQAEAPGARGLERLMQTPVSTGGLNDQLLGKAAAWLGKEGSSILGGASGATLAHSPQQRLAALRAAQEAPRVRDRGHWYDEIKRLVYNQLEPTFKWADQAEAAGISIPSILDPRKMGPTLLGGGLGPADVWMEKARLPVEKINQSGLRDSLDTLLTLNSVTRIHGTADETITRLNQEMGKRLARGQSISDEVGQWRKLVESQQKGTLGPGGLSAQDADQLRAELFARHTPGERAALEEAAQGLHDMNAEALLALRDEGIITAEEAQHYLDRGLLYTPVQQLVGGEFKNGVLWMPRRALATQTAFARQGGRLSLRTESLIKRLEGPDVITYSESPTLASMNYVREAAQEVARNKFAKVMVRQREWSPEAAALIRPYSPNERLAPNMGTVSFFENGQVQTWTLPIEMADALEFAHTADVGTGLKAMTLGRRLIQSLATSLNLAFLPRNQPRDWMDAAMLTRGLGVEDLAEFGQLWARNVKQILDEEMTEVRRRFKMSGADYATITKNIAPQEFFPQPSRSPLAQTRRLLNATEQATKESAFEILTRPGGRFHGDDVAAAAEVRKFAGSPDFGQWGAASKRASEFVLFFNPQVQGVGRLLGRYKEEPERLLWHMGGITAMLGALHAHNLQFINPDTGRPALEDIPEAERQSNLIIFRPTEETVSSGQRRYTYYRIPLGHAARTLWIPIQDAYRMFGNGDFGADPSVRPDETLVDTLATLLPGQLKYDPARPFSSTAGSVLSGLNPLIKVPVEQFTDLNSFTQAPIVGRRLSQLPAAAQTNYSTSPTMQAVGSLVGQGLGDVPLASPVRLEHIYRSLFPGPGEFLLSGTDRLLGGTPPGPRSSAEYTVDIPVLGPLARGWLGTPTSQVRQDAASALYNRVEELSKVVALVNQATPEERAELGRDPQILEQLQEFRVLERKRRRLGELARLKNEVRSAPNADTLLRNLWNEEMAILGVTNRNDAPSP